MCAIKYMSSTPKTPVFTKVSPSLDLTASIDHNEQEVAISVATLLHHLASEIGSERMKLNSEEYYVRFSIEKHNKDMRVKIEVFEEKSPYVIWS